MILVFKIKYLLILILLIFSSCDDDSLTNDEIVGCTDNFACNFDYYATIDNENCLYFDCKPEPECGGSAFLDECSECVDTQNDACIQDCQDQWGGVANEDCCGNCDTNSTNDCLLIEDSCIYNVEIFVCELEYVDLNEVIHELRIWVDEETKKTVKSAMLHANLI